MINMLFNQYISISGVAKNQQDHLIREIVGMSEQQLLGASVEQLVAILGQKYQVNVPVLDIEKSKISTSDTQAVLEIPFSGDGELFYYCPSSFGLNRPRAEVRNSCVILVESATGQNPEAVKASFEKSIQAIETYLECHRHDFQNFNDELPSFARQTVEERRTKLRDSHDLKEQLGGWLKTRK